MAPEPQQHPHQIHVGPLSFTALSSLTCLWSITNLALPLQKGGMEAAGNCGTPRSVPGDEADAETPRPCGPVLLDPEALGAAPTLS